MVMMVGKLINRPTISSDIQRKYGKVLTLFDEEFEPFRYRADFIQNSGTFSGFRGYNARSNFFQK